MYDQQLSDWWLELGKGHVGRLITGLAVGEPLQQLADALGVSVSTVYRRKCDPAIRQAVAEARADLNRQLLGRLAESQSRAHQVFIELLDHEDPAMRLRAANAVLTHGLRYQTSALTQTPAEPEPAADNPIAETALHNAMSDRAWDTVQPPQREECLEDDDE